MARNPAADVVGDEILNQTVAPTAKGLAGAGAAAAMGGLVGAAVPLAAQGIMALTPAAREQRKLDKKMRQDALRTLERGKEHGFGPSKARRNQQVARRMKDYDRGQAKAMDTLSRQEAVMGLGRSGAVQDQRAQMAEQRAGVQGQVRSQVEDEARYIGRQRENQALRQLGYERSKLDKQNLINRQTAGQIAQSGIQTGLAAYRGAIKQTEDNTWDKKKLEQAGSRVGVQYDASNRGDHTV